VEVKGKGKVEFPNAFTPSLAGPSDGQYDPNSPTNNVFHPQAEGVLDYKLYIYNRWGELMFESKNIETGWDGYFNGKLCPQDVYIWKAEGKFINGKTFEESGDVTLLR
jgi:gliding motility-associated-like protein